MGWFRASPSILLASLEKSSILLMGHDGEFHSVFPSSISRTVSL